MPPSSSMCTRRGPSIPRWSQTDAEPGPPLKENVSGRDEGSSVPFNVYAMKKISPSTSPVSVLIGNLPVVTS